MTNIDEKFFENDEFVLFKSGYPSQWFPSKFIENDWLENEYGKINGQIIERECFIIVIEIIDRR